MEIGILTDGSTREELIEALGHVNREAMRTLQRDHLNRPNERWDKLHAFIDQVLDLLEKSDAAGV